MTDFEKVFVEAPEAPAAAPATDFEKVFAEAPDEAPAQPADQPEAHTGIWAGLLGRSASESIALKRREQSDVTDAKVREQEAAAGAAALKAAGDPLFGLNPRPGPLAGPETEAWQNVYEEKTILPLAPSENGPWAITNTPGQSNQERMRDERHDKLRAAQKLKVGPVENEADILRLQNVLKVPAENVRKGYQQFVSMAKQETFDPAKWEAENPATARLIWMHPHLTPTAVARVEPGPLEVFMAELRRWAYGAAPTAEQLVHADVEQRKLEGTKVSRGGKGGRGQPPESAGVTGEAAPIESPLTLANAEAQVARAEEESKALYEESTQPRDEVRDVTLESATLAQSPRLAARLEEQKLRFQANYHRFTVIQPMVKQLANAEFAQALKQLANAEFAQALGVRNDKYALYQSPVELRQKLADERLKEKNLDLADKSGLWRDITLANEGVSSSAYIIGKTLETGGKWGTAAGLLVGLPTLAVTKSPALAFKAGAEAGMKVARITGAAEAANQAFELEFTDAWESIRGLPTADGGEVGPLEAYVAATAVGIINAGLEYASLSLVTKSLRGTAAQAIRGALVRDPQFRKLLVRLGKEHLSGTLGEMSTEAAQSLVQQIGAYFATDGKAQLDLQRTVQEGQGGLLSGFLMGGGSGLGALGINALHTHNAERITDALPLLAAVAADPVVQQSPREHAELIKEVTGADGAAFDAVYVDVSNPEAQKALSQSGIPNPEEAVRDLLGPEAAMRWKEAIQTGARFEVGLDEALGKWLNSQMGKALLQDSSASPAHMTLRQRAETNLDLQVAEAQRVLEAAWGESTLEVQAKGVAEELDRMRGELAAAGFEEKSADAGVKLWSAFYRTMSKRAGIKPEDYVKQFRATFGLLEKDARQLMPEDTLNLLARWHRQETEEAGKLGFEQRLGDFYVDDTTGALNNRAWTRVERTSMQVAVIKPEGVKHFNTAFGHQGGDNVYRATVQALRNAGAKLVFKPGGDIAIPDLSQEEVDDLVARANLDPILQGTKLIGASAQSLRDATTAANDRADVEEKAGNRAKRGERPLGWTGTQLSVPADFFLQSGNASRAAIPEALVEELRNMPSEAAFREAHIEPATGLLTPTGRNRALEARPRLFQANLDLNLLKPLNDHLGKMLGSKEAGQAAADFILLELGRLMTEMGGAALLATHVSGDEYSLHSDNADLLKAYLARLEIAFARVTVVVPLDNGALHITKLSLASGVGKTYDEAESDLEASKQRAAAAGKRSADPAVAATLAADRVTFLPAGRDGAAEAGPVGRPSVPDARWAPPVSTGQHRWLDAGHLAQVLHRRAGRSVEGAGPGAGAGRLTPSLLSVSPADQAAAYARVERMRNEGEKAKAKAWLDYCLGVGERPVGEQAPSTSVRNGFAKVGIIDPELGFTSDESGRSQERVGRGRKRNYAAPGTNARSIQLAAAQDFNRALGRRDMSDTPYLGQGEVGPQEAEVIENIDEVRADIVDPELVRQIRAETGAPIRDDGTLNLGEVLEGGLTLDFVDVTPSTGKVLKQTKDMEGWFEKFEKHPLVRKMYSEKELDELFVQMAATRAIYSHAYDVGLMPDETETFTTSTGKTRTANPLRPNADFKVSFDISTICPKQDQFVAQVYAVERRIGRILMPDERYKLGLMMRDINLQPACWYCYGQASRDVFDATVDRALVRTQRVLDGVPPDEAWEDWNPDSALVAFVNKHKDELAEAGLPDDVTLRDWVRNEKKRPEGLLGNYVQAVGDFVQSATKANAPKPWATLKDQILRMRPALIERLNARAGLRLNSQTDFRPWHVIEMVEAVAQMYAQGLKAHVYTKQSDFLSVLGGTGIKFNLSALYAREKDGKLKRDEKTGKPIFDDVIGMSGEDIEYWIAKYPEDAGGMLVAHNDEALLEGLNDERIHQIIPYHAGSLSQFREIETTESAIDYAQKQHETGWKTEAVLEKGRKNKTTFVLVQGKRVKKGQPVEVKLKSGVTVTVRAGVSLDHSAHLSDRATYFELVETLGLTPKFNDAMLTFKLPGEKAAKLRSVTQHPNYMKLIRDVAREPGNQRVPDTRLVDWAAADAVIQRWIADGGDDTTASKEATDALVERINAGKWPEKAAPTEAMMEDARAKVRAAKEREAKDAKTDEKRLAFLDKKGVLPGGKKKGAKSSVLKQSVPAPLWFSQVAAVVSVAKQEKNNAAGWWGAIKNSPGVKPEELDYLGLKEWLDAQKGTIARSAVLAYIDAHKLNVTERVLDDAGTREVRLAEAGRAMEEAARGLMAAIREDLAAAKKKHKDGGPYVAALKDALDGAEALLRERAEHVNGTLNDIYDVMVGLEDVKGGFAKTKPAFRRARDAGSHLFLVWDGQDYNPSAPEYGAYVSAGKKENYRELLFYAPGTPADLYTSQHFQGNGEGLLAHARFSERQVDGKRALFIEEVQSDLHQLGRDSGYDTGKVSALLAQVQELRSRVDRLSDAMDRADIEVSEARGMGKAEAQAAYDTLLVEYKNTKQELRTAREELTAAEREASGSAVGAPDAPLKNSWEDMVLKRMVRWAADNGFDTIAWPKSSEHVRRYPGVAHDVGFVEWNKTQGVLVLGPRGPGESVYHENVQSKEDITKLVGVDVAEKLMAQEEVPGPDRPGWPSVVFQSLKLPRGTLTVGGEAFRVRYDRSIPKAMARLAGAPVKEGSLRVAQPVEERFSIVAPTGRGQLFAVYEFNRIVFQAETFEEANAKLSELEATAAEDSRAESVWVVSIPAEKLEKARTQGMPLFQGEKKERGRIILPPQENQEKAYRVFFTPNADVSTIAHESAHAFMDLMEYHAAQPDAPKGIVDDWAKTMAWLGIAKASELTDDMKERWARGFEAYLREGRSPARALDGAFTRFRLWLTSIYRAVSQLDVELNDDIRGVFDRLVATEEEIKAHKGQRGEALDLVALGLQTQQEAADLQDEDLLTENFYTRKALLMAMRERLRETEDWWKEEEERLGAIASDEYDALPLTLGLATLDGTLNLDAEGKPTPIPLKRSEVEAVLGKQKRIRTADDGTPIDEAAQTLGFATGKAMLEGLSTHPTRAVWVKRQVKAQMAAQHGDIRRDRSLLKRAVADGFNDITTKKILREWSALWKLAPSHPAPPVDILRRAAKAFVDARRLRKLDAGQHLAQERGWASKAAKAAAKGNYDAAIEAKKQQMQQAFIHAELSKAQELRDELVKLGQSLSKEAARGKLGKAHPSLRILVDALLTAAGLSDTGPELTQEVVQAAVERMEAVGHQAGEWSDALVMRMPATDYRDLTVADARLLVDALKQAKAVAADINTMLVGGKRYDKEQVVSAVVAEGRGALPPRGPAKEKGSRGPLEKALDTVDGIDSFLVSSVDVIRDLIGDDVNYQDTMLWKVFVQPLRDARHKEADLLASTVQPIVNAFEKMSKTMRGNLMDDVDGARLFPTHTKKVAPPAKRFELLVMALNAGNAGNLHRLTEGRQISEEEVRNALATLTREELDWVQSVWDAMESLRAPAFDLEERLTGLRPEAVEAQPLILKNGTLRGGYFPAVYRSDATTVGAMMEGDALAKLLDPSYTRPSTPHSHLKKRAEDFSAVISLDPGVIYRHLGQVAHDITHREAVLSIGSILLNTDVQDMLRERVGPKKTKDMLQWLKDVGTQGGQVVMSDALAFVQALRSNMGPHLLGLNLPLAIGDFANLATSVTGTKLKTKHLMRALTTAWGRDWTKTYEDILKRSPEMRSMQQTLLQQFRAQTRSMMQTPTQQKLDWVRTHAFVLQEAVQRWTAAPIWLAAHTQAIEDGKTEAQAVEWADDILARTFPSHAAMEQAGILRDKGYLGVVTMFYGYFSRAYGQNHAILRELFTMDFQRKPPGQYLKGLLSVGASLLGFWLSMGVLAELAMGRGPEDDDEDRHIAWAKWFARRLALAPLSLVPFELSQIGESVISGKPLNPRASPLVALGKAAYDAGTKGANGDADAWTRVESILRVPAMGLGLPLSPVTKQGGAIYRLATGQSRARNPLEAAGSITWGERATHRQDNVTTAITDFVEWLAQERR